MTELDFMDEIGEQLRTIANRQGISQRELSRRSGINISLINRYFNGKTIPSFKNIVNICYELDCSLDDIMMTADRVE